MAQYTPEGPGNVLVLPQLAPPIGPLFPLPAPQTAVEFPSDINGCDECECVFFDAATGWGFGWRTGPCDPMVDVTGDGRNLQQLCQSEFDSKFIDGTGIPLNNGCFIPPWAGPNPSTAGGGYPTACEAAAWDMACGDAPAVVALRGACGPNETLTPYGVGAVCVPSIIVPPPPPPPGGCPKGCPPDINGNCHCDPPLPLASDGNGFAEPSGPYALPVHPTLSAASMASCGVCNGELVDDGIEAEL